MVYLSHSEMGVSVTDWKRGVSLLDWERGDLARREGCFYQTEIDCGELSMSFLLFDKV